jgi:hypothetical protein
MTWHCGLALLGILACAAEKAAVAEGSMPLCCNFKCVAGVASNTHPSGGNNSVS